jgi:hypothetical protein
MRKLTHIRRAREAAEGLVVIIILIAVLGGIAWWLFNTKNTSDREGRAFARAVINRLAVQHDQKFLSDNLGPQARQEDTRSRQEYIIGKLKEFGVPAQPIPIEESMTFESQFFSPRGFFIAKLNYPGQLAVMQIAISHPVGKWQLDTIDVTWQPAR